MILTKKIRRRMWVVLFALMLLLGVVSARLFYLQVLHADRFIQLAQEQSQGNLLTLPVRGKIFDRNLKPLAESIDTKSVVMAASKFDPDSEALQKVSNALGIDLAKVNPATSQHTRLTYLKRQLTPEELTGMREVSSQEALRGSEVFLIPDTKRFYPQQKLASHILGFTGLDDKGYDNHGLEGIEFYYDQYLRGHAAQYSVPMDAKRNSLNTWELEVKNVGYNLVLTIDKNIQHMVERELETTFRQERARHAIVIVMNPHTGEILALANYPDFNPNSFRNYPQTYYQNLAVAWEYEPGSTFKIVQTAGAFEEGILSPHARLDKNGAFLDGAEPPESEWKQLGYLSVEDILVQSNNTGAMLISAQLGEKRFYDYIKRFGFGDLTGIDLPGEVSGRIRELKDWSSISRQSLSLGQEISVTAIQMARVFAVIANGGLLYTPYIVREIQQMDGTPVMRTEPSKPRRVISPRTAELLREILAKVVERGTGKQAAVKGYQVAGKTGTAQKFNSVLGDYSSTSLVTSFIGFAPAEEPKVVIAAIVDEPALNEWGSTVAAPLFKRIAERVLPYLDISPEKDAPELIALKMEDF